MADEHSTLECPRCHATVSQEFYGPCANCRNELVAKYATIGRSDVVVEEYVPKMNVTPNAVALKDD